MTADGKAKAARSKAGKAKAGGAEAGGRKRKGKAPDTAAPAALAALALPAPDDLAGSDLTEADLTAAHDLTLLEQNRMRWLLGDWDALAAIPAADLRGHPQRARLALLVAAAHAQRGGIEAARLFLQLAAGWGCDRGLIRRVMVSGLYNTLGRAAAAAGEPERAQAHFAAAIQLGAPGSETALLARARMASQTGAAAGPRPDGAAVGAAVGAALRDTGAGDALPEQERPARSPRPFTVVIAGVPRSGSTWTYNAVRLLLERDGRKPYAAWVKDYRPAEHRQAAAHVVKVHNPEQLAFPYDRLVTTNRDIVDRLASLIRMGWLQRSPEAVRNAFSGHQKLYDFWRTRSDAEIAFETIVRWPERAVQVLADAVSVPCDARKAAAIARAIDAIPVPDRGGQHDPVTQLHPSHRSDGRETAEIASWIRTVLADVRQPG